MKFTLKNVENYANQNGFAIEKTGRKYEVWKVDQNGCGPTDGMTSEFNTLRGAYYFMYWEVN